MKSIEEAEIKAGTKVLVRVDWNVPVDEAGLPTDSSRIEATLLTIEYIKNKGGLPIIASHFGREGDSIETVINFAKQKYSVLTAGVEFLENLRIDKREENNDESFAKDLASKADIYVNEAFSVSHREHASIVGVPKFLPAFAGFHFMKEFQNLSKAFNPERPFLFILGGAKFETKLPLLEKFLELADDVFIGGALAVKALEMSDKNGVPIADNPKVIFPEGDIVAPDINPETLAIIKEKIDQAQFILWNGPLGNYEKGFIAGTVALARMLSESSAKVVVGGGDTLAVVNKDVQKVITQHGFISTAGGAMLDFLAKGTLPGIEALQNQISLE
ncbi:MAG: phosphoglycerate kinase [Parcubacteria group bacterium]|jgi:phosphoglycerate kinase|nr:phosphoglycerate kinase [Parcubacteria group bacterium]